MVSTPPRAKFVRKLFYGRAIPACALFIGVLFAHQPYSETAPRSLANTIVDVAALEATNNICRDRMCRPRSINRRAKARMSALGDKADIGRTSVNAGLLIQSGLSYW